MLSGFDQHFQIIRKLKDQGTRSFVLAKNLKTDESVIVKINEVNPFDQTLKNESSIYHRINEDPTSFEHVSSVHYYGVNENGECLVLDHFGENLQDLFQLCGKKFTLKTVLMLADQMLDRIRFIHKNGVLHRDIKPSNFVMGLGKNTDKVYLIDFGISTVYILPDGSHMPWKERGFILGTKQFASINALVCNETGRKDDLESLGYTLIYFLKGTLPWHQIPDDLKHCTPIWALKMTLIRSKIYFEDLYDNIPIEFKTYLKYVADLRFLSEPNYDYLQNLFRDLMKKEGHDYDFKYDWIDKLK